MHVLQQVSTVLSVVLTIWGAIALVLGPYLFFKARTYFPERKETVSPEMLAEKFRESTEAIAAKFVTSDHALREAFQREVNTLGTRITDSREDILVALRSVEGRAHEALERSQAAEHAAEMLKQRLDDFDRLVLEKLDHQKTLINALQAWDRWTERRGSGSQGQGMTG